MSLIEVHQFATRLRSCFGLQHNLKGPAGPAAGAVREFEALALELFELQFTHNPAYRRFCISRGVSPGTVKRWGEIPAIPSAAFKELDVTVLPVEQRTSVFHSSGTTGQRPSRHFHCAQSLSLYESSLVPWFSDHLLPEVAGTQVGLRPTTLVALTPNPSIAEGSSLVHMFDAISRNGRWTRLDFLGTQSQSGGWELDTSAAWEILLEAERAGEPVLLLGTAFSFVHLLDKLAHGREMHLPPGSRAMETGGYKGRSRELTKASLHDLIQEGLGIPESNIVSEYGMSELSSQAYDRVCGTMYPGRVYRFPPWVRVRVVSPETGREVADGESGLIRIFDLANVYSALALQTEDLGVKDGDGFELLGRNRHAEPRGCSLMSASV